MKIIKIIDLLNKIANGEEVPEKIKYEGKEFEYNEYQEDYFNKEYMIGVLDKIRLFNHLNNEVEIIEEEQDIEELRLMFPICNDIKNAELGGFASIYKSNLENIKYKIDELVIAVNELRGKYE